MTAGVISLLAVMLLTDPTERIDAEAAAAVSEDADRVELSTAPKEEKPQSASIRSVSSDFDRQAGVILFEGDVVVDYGSDYTLCADRAYAFLSVSNELTRIVAVGHVSITNDARVGSCAMATYRRRRHEIEMFGDGKGSVARLVESGENASELAGSRIKFWIDTEQVEVDNSEITTGTEGGGALL